MLCSLMKVAVFLPLMLFKYSLHLHLTSGLPLNHFKQSFRCKSSLFYSLTLTNCLLRGLKMNAEMEWSVEMIDMFLVHYWSSRPHPPSTINCADGGCTFALKQNQNHDLCIQPDYIEPDWIVFPLGLCVSLCLASVQF